ncbi:Pectate lyase [Actinidia chinensis var. chinensis]|uniref:Pectate lyase n=1 Tax=Actinidia chinensis var. chinensis TaxID=1590841 RepID=A0A2R6RFD2_ACTCC|nr:Pectate lyase [Actinidia chinensis var. chinensis]
MAMVNRNSFFFFFLFIVAMIPALHANYAELDKYWQHKAKEAQKSAFQAYSHNPEEVTDSVNKQVGVDLMGNNGTRRNLRKYNGPCRAENPIDRCWRCRPDWMKNRKRLADCVIGFGRNTSGGRDGAFYLVSDPSDNDMVNPKPGTLRHAVTRKEPLWIIFDRSMNIRLNQELIMTSNKTIDARGANVHIAYGAGITIQYVQNVIIHGLHIHDIVPGSGGMIRDSEDHFGFRTRSDGDGISIFGGVNIWIDHVSMSNCSDGLIDAIMGSTGITISNCHFTRHNEVMLFGANDSHTIDEIMQITVAFNHFGQGLVQRMPRCRFGFVHVVNNDYTHWLMYAIGGSSHPTIISQGNRFIAPPDPNAKQVTKRDYATTDEWSKWQWRSEGDLMMNGAFFLESGEPLKKNPLSTLDMIGAKPGSYVSRLTRFTGPLKCKPNKPC